MKLCPSFLVSFVPGGGAVATALDVASGAIRFATSTVGMIGIASALSFGGGWRLAEQRCEAGRLSAELATVRADLRAAQDAEAHATEQAAGLEAEDRANQDKVNALAADLKKRPARSCGLSRDDARRLRGIN